LCQELKTYLISRREKKRFLRLILDLDIIRYALRKRKFTRHLFELGMGIMIFLYFHSI